ncbi:spore germination protein GerPC [Bacillus gobiensis]|uniref:spore germination protein GerPC n=1 Tax=Bacillus gobiensis TaxID=1441095 RepID=UPI003D25DBFB
MQKYPPNVNTPHQQNMQSYYQHQASKIEELEKKLADLQKQIDALQDRPNTKIDKIEYKFDQLKIEKLEGTLNIGLNPLDPNQVDNFEVSQNQPASPQGPLYQQGMPPQQDMQLPVFQRSRQLVEMFLIEEAPLLIEQLEQRFNQRLDDANRLHIVNDIRKQMDSRIRYYLAHLKPSDNASPEQHADQIASHVKRDVSNAIEHFLRHIPDEMKGADHE